MTTVDSFSDGPNASPAPPPRVPAFGRLTSVATILAIFVLAVVTWWALGDPRWGLAKASDSAGVTTNLAVVGCILFWVIFAHIFTGFTFANWPFNGLSQPLAGIAHVIANLFIGLFGVVLFTRGIGAWDPTFSVDAAAGAGYTAAAFVVLIGFYAYALPAANLAGYPFETPPSPTASLGQWLFCAFLTTVGTVALIYPNFNTQLAAHAPIALPTVTGWIYSSIVIVIITAMILGNWPWSLIKGRHTRALATFASTLAGGFVLMLILEQLLRLIVPDFVLNAKSFSIALETAQLGVCIAYCSLTWGLIIAPPPPTSVVTGVVRTLLVAGAGIVVYVVFMRVFATSVLHFPAVQGTYGGNPLLWIDWMILLLLWHAVAFGGYFSTRPASKA